MSGQAYLGLHFPKPPLGISSRLLCLRLRPINLTEGPQKSIGKKLRLIMLPDHWAEQLHHESVMGGEVTRRGTRGTHGECAEAKMGCTKVILVRADRVVLLLS
jgi:hypothetical protein